ncbi:hypothetical protein Tco_0809573, partial [Tanacetum coccineum]
MKTESSLLLPISSHPPSHLRKKIHHFESLKFLQRQLFRSLEDWEVSSLQFMQRNTNNVKDSELASLFGKLKYEENLIDSIYETEKNKSLISTTPLSTAFFSSSIFQDFQDSPDDEEDTRSNHEYLNDLEEEYQVRALLSKSKRFFKKASKASMVKNKGLIVEAYEWYKEEVSSDDNEMVEVKVLMALAEENVVVSKKANDTKVTIPGVERPWLSEAEGSILPNYDTGRILPAESQRNTIAPSVAVSDSSVTDYDLADESSVCNTPLPTQKKLNGAEPISGPKTIKSILSSSASKVHSAPAGKLKSVKIEDDLPLAVVMKELNNLKLQFSKNQSSYSRRLSFEKERSIQEILNIHSKDVKFVVAQLIPQLITMISNGSKECDIKKPIWYLDSGCSRHITGVKSYLHKYVEQSRPKVVFGDDPTCTTEGYGSIKCNGIVFIKVAFVNGLKYNLISISQLCDAKYIVQFDEKRGTIFNSNKEVVMIAPRVRDVYVLEMTSSAQESCFFAKASENINCLWHKRLVHLN